MEFLVYFSNSKQTLFSLLELPQTFSKLDVGHKMNSYTIPDLVPSTNYILELFLSRNNHQVKISSLLVTTKQEDYIKEYGIRKNYSAIILLGNLDIHNSCISLVHLCKRSMSYLFLLCSSKIFSQYIFQQP